MPNYVYTVDGNEELYFPLMSGGTVSNEPPPTPAPTPTEPTPTEPTPTEPTLTEPPITTFGGGGGGGHCFDGPIILTESIAADIRNNNLLSYTTLVNSLSNFPVCFETNLDPMALASLANSPVPSVRMDVQQWFGQGEPSPWPIPVKYAGYQVISPSVPGTVIEETPPPAPTMPPPVIPPIIPQIETAIQTAIEEPVTESRQCIDRITGQIRGQIDYQLAQAALPIPKLESKISSNIINTMGEVYNNVYPVGLGIPSTDQIISGEAVYSPYGIGADIPYCDQVTPTPTPTGPTPPPVTPPGVTCPAPVVQCPAPPDINFAPNINIQIPQQGTPTVNVNIPVTPTPTPTEPTPTEPTPTEPTPTPSPTPTEPTPTEPTIIVVEPPAPTEPEPPTPTEPTPTPTPTPPPPAPTPTTPKPPPLDLGDTTPQATIDPWATGAGCAVPIRQPANIGADLWGAFGWKFVGKNEVKPPDYLNPEKYPIAFQWFGSLAMNFVGTIIDSTYKAVIASQPIANNFSDFLVLAFGGAVERWVGAPVTQFLQSNVYNINYQNPQRIPSEAEVVSLFLANEIDFDTMKCLVRANGSYDTWYSKIANANRTRISNEQIIQLYRREIIPGAFADKLMRQNGVIDQNEANMLYRATEALPSTSDIVRFMVRDADDDTVAGKYGTDAAFDTKYGRQLKLWAKGQGITDEVMKYYWRSHWEIPSNTALFEMLHRLRPNRESSGNQTGPTVTTNDIKDALVVNDMLPFWAERMIEISYRPLTRTDAQRAFFIDALSEQELKDAYLDIGYNESNADKLVRFTKQLKAQRKQAKGGTEKATSVLKYYKNWLIGNTEAKQRLMNGGLSEQAANEALEIADNQRKNDSQILCIKGVKSKYKKYQITDIEAQVELNSIGMALENIAPTIKIWNCERSFRPKELTLSQTCKAYQENLITDEEYRKRLAAIGYMEDESGILLEICAAAKANKNTGKRDTTRIRSTEEKTAQTEAARNITKAALDAIAQEGPK